MPALVTPQDRSQSASASRSLRTARNSRVSCCRRPFRVSLGTRMVTITPALPISIPATRSANSGSSSTSCIVISYHENAVVVKRSWPSEGAGGNRKSGPRARSTNSRPSKQLPAIRLVDGVKPAKGQRRQRTATPILATAPRRRSRLWPAPFPPTAPRARQRTPATYDGSAPRDFHATRRPLATRDWWLIRRQSGLARRGTPVLDLVFRMIWLRPPSPLSPSPDAGRRLELVMSVVPQPWPQPAPQPAGAVAAMYRGRRERPLPVLVRDKLGEWLSDDQFAGAYGVRGKPGWPPSRLALVTVFQMAEDLTDRQAAEAVRTRIDWKYALGLDLADPGFDDSILSEFRARVAGGGLDQVVLDTLLERLAAGGLVPAGGKMRTDSTHVVSAVRDLNRLELAGESVRACLEQLVVAAPQVVAQLLDESWGKRYAARIDTWRMPASATKKDELALAYGRDGRTLLKAVYAAAGSDPDLAFLAGLHQVQVLRVVLLQNYLTVEDERGREVIRRREAQAEGLPPGRSRVSEILCAEVIEISVSAGHR